MGINMIYESNRLRLVPVQVICRNDANDVQVCQDTFSAAGSYYTVIAIRDHVLTKELLEVFENADETAKENIIDTFSCQGEFIVVFPYKPQRLLGSFYMGDAYTLSESEEICMSLILACMDCRLPWPVLSLILSQRQIHLAKDHSVYLGYELDFQGLAPEVDEKECVSECAEVLLSLLEPVAAQKAISYQLLQKKTANRSYTKFTELYRDVRMSAVSKGKRGIRAMLLGWFYRNRDTLFAVLLRVSIVLAVFALAAFLTQLLFGDIPWIQILFNHFKVIGTESLLQ